MLESLHGANGLAHDSCGLFQREVPDDPERQNDSLVFAETVEEVDEAVGLDAFHGFVLHVATGQLGEGMVGGGGSPPDRPPPVDGPPVGDHEHPGTEGGLVAFELVDVPSDLEEHLAGEILGITDTEAGEIPGDRTGELPVDLGPGALISTTRPFDSVRSADQTDSVTKLYQRIPCSHPSTG